MKRGDVLALLLAVSILPPLYVMLWHDGRGGDYARILVGGEQRELVSLHEDRTLEVAGALGVSTLEVKDGQIRFLASPCPGQQCVHNGWIHFGGDVLTCLPNKISVAILGGEQRFDSVNF